MKNDVMPSIVRMEQELLEKLVVEVKETIATGIVMPNASMRSFGIVDMWNIRKQRRYTGSYLRKR